MAEQILMDNTIIRSKILITDFQRHSNHSESSGSEVHAQSMAEEDTEDSRVDDDEVLLMQSLGLPTRFTSTKKYYKCKEYLPNNEFDVENINRKFLDYWQENGDNLVLSSWVAKYKDYINPEFLDGCDLNSLKDDSFVQKCDIEHDWSEKWNEHYWSQYESEYQIFVSGLFDSSLSTRIKNIVLNPNEAVEGDNSDTNSSQSKNIIITIDDQKQTSSVTKRSGISLLGSGGDEEDEPPEERPVKIKKQCESDANLSGEDEAQQRKDEFHRKPSVSSIEPIDPSEVNDDTKEGGWKTQMKKKKKERKRKCNSSWHWQKRYRLFSRFDEGIQLDDESWYSVTPEKIAAHIANRIIGEDVNLIFDGFCGAGGNTIQFALAAPHIRVIAVDVDSKKIALAKHNAEIYGVDQRIDFIVADFLDVPKLLNVKVDAVFVSPPWGGPDYKKSEKYRLEMMSPDVGKILEACRALTPNIAFYLPRNIDESDLLRIAKSTFEIEQNILNGKLLTVTAYFGNLIKNKTT